MIRSDFIVMAAIQNYSSVPQNYRGEKRRGVYQFDQQSNGVWSVSESNCVLNRLT